MLNKISFPLAINVLLILVALSLAFHFLVISGIIPYQIVWGGRINSQEEMIQFETVSILINLVLLIIAIYRKKKQGNSFFSILFLVFTALFLVNTVLNLLSKTTFEMVVFTPLTLILAILSARIALAKN